jgi:hypothetical protein
VYKNAWKGYTIPYGLLTTYCIYVTFSFSVKEAFHNMCITDFQMYHRCVISTYTYFMFCVIERFSRKSYLLGKVYRIVVSRKPQKRKVHYNCNVTHYMPCKLIKSTFAFQSFTPFFEKCDPNINPLFYTLT